MKTLVFCTGYAEHRAVWEMRHAWWLKSIQNSDLEYDQLLIVDDGSPELPDWKDVQIVREAEAPTPEDVKTNAPVLLYTHSQRLGRHAVFDFPGWHRSFAFGALYAHAHGFEKVIHIESDAHLISPRIRAYFNAFNEGWAAVWNPKYTFPELAIQVIAGTEVANFSSFARRPYGEWVGLNHETLVPYTHVETRFIGDRYGEWRDDVPRNVDFIAQSLINQGEDYYWWIEGTKNKTKRLVRKQSLPSNQSQTLESFPPFFDVTLTGNWSHPEPSIRWMTDFDSGVVLPPIKVDGTCRIEVGVRPCVSSNFQSSQRLLILVNEYLISEVALLRETTIGCDVPASALGSSEQICIRFMHPDSFSPAAADPTSSDSRRLSIGMSKLIIQFVAQSQPRKIANLLKRPMVRMSGWKTPI